MRVYNFNNAEVGTICGRGLFDFGDVDGPPKVGRMQHPMDLCTGERELYVVDTYNHKLKELQLSSGSSRTVCSELNEPQGIDRMGDYLFVTDTNNHRIVAIHRWTGELRQLDG